MPNKDINKLKDPTSRMVANQWRESLGLRRMDTREWNRAADMAAEGKSNDQIKREIMRNRRK